MKSKKCPRCKTTFPVTKEHYYIRKNGWHSYLCKSCTIADVGNYVKRKTKEDPEWAAKFRAKRNEAAKRHRRKMYGLDNQYYRSRSLLSRVGISLEQYDDMLERQGGRCAICLTSEAGGRFGRFHVDHIHGTKTVRGLLCSRCNVGIGQFKENETSLLAAVKYLRERGRAE